MKKFLIAMLLCALLCSGCLAETSWRSQPHPLATAQRAVVLPQGYVLLNQGTMDLARADSALWPSIAAAMGDAFAPEANADLILSESGAVAMEIRNIGFVGGNHTRLPELQETFRKQFENDLASKGAVMGGGELMRQYAGHLHLGAFSVSAQGQPVGRIVTIDDDGQLIEIWSYVDENTTGILLDTLGQAAAVTAPLAPEVPAAEAQPVAPVVPVVPTQAPAAETSVAPVSQPASGFWGNGFSVGAPKNPTPVQAEPTAVPPEAFAQAEATAVPPETASATRAPAGEEAMAARRASNIASRVHATAMPPEAVITVTEDLAPVQQPASQISTGKAAVLAELGVYNYGELSHIQNVTMTENGGIQEYRVEFMASKLDSYSDGFEYDWRTSSGALSDMDLDWDRDGLEEYLVLYAADAADSSADPERRLMLAVYEPDGQGGYVKADECCLGNHHNPGYYRAMTLESGADGLYLVSSVRGDDAAWVNYQINVYSYNGSQIALNAVADAATSDRKPSFVALGPLDPDSVEDVREAGKLLKDMPKMAAYMNLFEGENIFATGGYEKHSGNANYLRAAVDGVAEKLAPLGVILTTAQDGNGPVDVQLVSSGELFWATDESYQTTGGAFAVDYLRSSADHSAQAGLAAPVSGIQAPSAPASQEAVQPDATKAPAAEMPFQLENPTEPSHVYPTDDVNVRSGPGTNNGKIGSVNRGQVVPYAGQSQTDSKGTKWHAIDYNGAIGWISGEYSVLIMPGE